MLRIPPLMMKNQCPYCEYRPTHRTAVQSVNRHLKNYSEKEDPRKCKGHPAKDSPEFQALVEERGLYENCKTDVERYQRRSHTQLTQRQKRKTRNTDKVRGALYQLRYLYLLVVF